MKILALINMTKSIMSDSLIKLVLRYILSIDSISSLNKNFLRDPLKSLSSFSTISTSFIEKFWINPFARFALSDLNACDLGKYFPKIILKIHLVYPSLNF